MLLSLDYFSKYGPLLHLLDSETDLDVLAGEEGYRQEIGASYRDLRRQVMRGYLIELQQDFGNLYDAAAPHAVHDTGLASTLVQTQRSLSRASRHIRFRLFLEAVLPVPESATSGMGRRFIRWAIPRNGSPQGLLAGMNEIRQALAL